jgi:sorting nexin-9/18/33
MAEIETYHTQKVEDFASLAKEHLDGEIEFYEQVSQRRTFFVKLTQRHDDGYYSVPLHVTQVLLRLRTARRTFDPPIYPGLLSGGTRQPSMYERDLDHPRLNPDPLPQPCQHVLDATPMSPVSHAIQEGVGLLLGSAANAVTGRGSVFGRFW